MYAADDWPGPVFPPEAAPRLDGFVFRIPVHMKAVFSSYERMTRAGDRRGSGGGVAWRAGRSNNSPERNAARGLAGYKALQSLFLSPVLWGIPSVTGVCTL